MRLPFALSAISSLISGLYSKLDIPYLPSSFILSVSIYFCPTLSLLAPSPPLRHPISLALGLLYSYLNLGKRKMEHIVFGIWFLFYHAYYPGFAGFYLGILIHALIRKYFNRSYLLKPLIINTIILIFLHLPAALYLRHYGQLPQQRLPENFGCIFNGSELFWLFKDCDHKCIFGGGIKRPCFAEARLSLIKFFLRLPLLAFFIFNGYRLLIFFSPPSAPITNVSIKLFNSIFIFTGGGLLGNSHYGPIAPG